MNWILLIKNAFDCAEDDSDYGSDFGEESGEKGMDNAFMESYSDALNKELSMTTIEKSFARAPHPDTSNEVILSHSISWLCLAQIACVLLKL